MRIGFVGTGVITEAIVKGLLKTNLSISSIVLSPRSSHIAEGLSMLSSRVHIARDNQEVVDRSNTVFLAIRPQVCHEVLSQIEFQTHQKIVSLVATVTHEKLMVWMPGVTQLTRAIPLPAVADRQGVTAIYPPDQQLAELFSNLGTVIECDDLRQFDLIATGSAIMGTYYGMLEICQRWLVEMGLKEDDATAYLKGVVNGLSEDMKTSDIESFEGLRSGHSTPGGLNDQVFKLFSSTGGATALRTGLEAVLKRIEAAH